MQANTHFMTAKEASKNWGISQRRVATLCSEGRVENATILGNMWLLPITAMKPDDARYLQKKDLVAKPFLKWAGGKGQLLTEISNRLPEGLGGTINKYAEPFIGGGALLFDILQNYDISEVYINDVNVALISAYRQVKYNVDELIKSLKTLQDEFIGLATEARKEYYYGKRTRFNTLVTGREKNEEELAALMIFINKTCFNGLYRVNRKGEYNVPMGDYKNPKICDDSNLLIISKLLQNVDINIGSYKEVLKFADQNTFIYFDPPYRPLSKTSDFTSYNEGGFNDNDQKELCGLATKLNEIGVKVMLSNSDPKNINDSDNFFDDLYAEFNIKRVNAKRMINSNSGNRGDITELLITNY